MMAQTEPTAALLIRAAAAREAGDAAEARRLLERALASGPADAELWRHLALACEQAGDLELAEAHLRKALELAPEDMATARLLAILLLSQGRYAEGFALFEARHAMDAYVKPRLPFSEWPGGDVAGRKILIWPEQGFGDQIQFARFAPILKAKGADVTLVCWPPLERLFAGSLGVRVIPARGEISFPDPDGWVMACSLAARLGVTVETVPGAPYLQSASPWPKALPPGVKVGLMTAGNRANANDRNRSLSGREAEALRSLPAQVIDLDPAATGAADFADTAAIVEQLDLVISVDTAVAHLAGAMGKPCWVLLPVQGLDWRWMRGRRDTPWYPSMRLYRQATPGDWAPVLGEIAADLEILVAGR
ncbi:tetratricopeptide repeat protein [Phenylobacterium sp. LjRoot225]|uniref:glycosyltransferase family 9 protein n=1 Tax=Phenylobacterium sp. LjRoot225 TaxID=3342285 RepID=UPI003ECD8BB2